jgi:hypothetical protein
MHESQIKEIINQIFEIEKKINGNDLEKSLNRNLRRMKSAVEGMGYHLHNPIGEKYDMTRLDCEAMVSGNSANNLKIVEVIKPIIYFRGDGTNSIVQKAVVVTEG